MPAKKQIINYLDNQHRQRAAEDYAEDLVLCWYPANGGNTLLVGGGYGCYGEGFATDRILGSFTFTNIDLHIDPLCMHNSQFANIQADYITYAGFKPGQFHEIWANYVLPVYAVSRAAAKLFYLKSMLYLAPGGHLRVCGPDTIARFDEIRAKCGKNYPAFAPIMEGARMELEYMEKILGMRILFSGTLSCADERLEIFKKPYEKVAEFNKAVQDRIDTIMSYSPELGFEVKIHNLLRKQTLSYNAK
ncbi:MAG: hypothetical protein LBG89_02830 [Rickettsiales bacterium]|jgi:hypothetical protein|nr:hypothetical protein [Rickettsiales bacterium]